MKLSNPLQNYKKYIQKTLLEIIQNKNTNKKQKSKIFFNCNHPFIVHRNRDFFEKTSGLEKLFIVGHNWLSNESKDKKFALMISFAQWKYGFVADYLSEYKTAFVHSTFLKIKFPFLINKINSQKTIDVIIIWGAKVPFWINYLAKIRNIPIYHMEDGFIRSALPGREQSLPHSLVLDRSGLYYDATRPSDIENILNNYDFHSDQDLLDKAHTCLSLYKNLKMSKYNPPIMENIDEVILKKVKRIAVIGQMSKDMSLKFGNPDNWTMLSLTHLAYEENPDADIFYRIHPDEEKRHVYIKDISDYAQITYPDSSITDFLNSMDQIYVINSLVGLEALLLNKKVTVVGHAFYAGWGLTDDRCTLKRRNKKLTLPELFAGIYLKYPRYLSNLEDNHIGFVSSCYSIKADQHYVAQKKYIEVRKKIRNFHLKFKNFNIYHIISNVKFFLDKDFKKYTNMSTLKNNLSIIFKSDFWPIVFKEQLQNVSTLQEKFLISQLPLGKIFHNRVPGEGKIFQHAFLYFIFNALHNSQSKDFFIKTVREFIDADILNQFLINVYNIFHDKYILEHLKWLLDNCDSENAQKLTEINHIIEHNILSNFPAQKLESDNSNFELTPLQKLKYVIPSGLFDLIDISIEEYNEKNLYNYTHKFFLLHIIKSPHKPIDTSIFLKMSVMAVKKGDLFSAYALANMINALNIDGHNGYAYHVLAENSYDLQKSTSEHNVFLKYTLQLKNAPQRLNRSWSILKKSFSETHNSYQIFSSIAGLYRKFDLKNVNYLIEVDKPQEAITVLDHMIEDNDFSDSVYIAYSKALSLLGRFEESKHIIEKAISKMITHQNIVEYIRLLRMEGNFEKAYDIAILGQKAHVDITGEAQLMPVNFGLKKIEEGFKCFLDTPLKKLLIKSFGQREMVRF